MRVGDALRLVMVAKRKSQQEIASEMGVSHQQVSHVMNNHTNPKLTTLEQYARTLDTPVWFILMLADQLTPCPTRSRPQMGGAELDPLVGRYFTGRAE